MLNQTASPLTVIGFTRYEKRASFKPEDLIQTSINWRRNFLEKQPGIAMHLLLGTLRLSCRMRSTVVMSL